MIITTLSLLQRIKKYTGIERQREQIPWPKKSLFAIVLIALLWSIYNLRDRRNWNLIAQFIREKKIVFVNFLIRFATRGFLRTSGTGPRYDVDIVPLAVHSGTRGISKLDSSSSLPGHTYQRTSQRSLTLFMYKNTKKKLCCSEHIFKLEIWASR